MSAGKALVQSRKSGEINLSPEAWPKNELDNYWQLHGMDPKKSVDTPNFMGPFFGLDPAGGTGSAQIDKEALAGGEFAGNVIEAVRAKGQAVRLLTKSEVEWQIGFWIAIQIDPKTSGRIGAVPSVYNGYVVGY